ncbi:MAG: OmpH family outer membrane protein [Gemmatimonadota bacterium]|nr:OmpH family outer membrane protein [Gemmatimonadota bacterium]
MKLDRSKRMIALSALGVLGIAGVAAIPTSSVQNPMQFAYVSTEVILRQTPGFVAAESTWNAEVTSYRAEVQILQRQLDSALTAFNQQAIVLSPTARQEKQTELQRLNEQLQQRTTEYSTRADERQRELMAPLEDRIQRVIDGLRAERALSAIFDVSAPGNNIVSADPVLDLTTTVVRRLTGQQQ